jgi:nitrite reductase/ring-hydroxylating ferredoxin subunit
VGVRAHCATNDWTPATAAYTAAHPTRRTHLDPNGFAPVRILPDARRLREGDGLRFAVVLDGVSRDAFAVRYRDRVFGYVNTCRHQSLQLDFGDAHFFDEPYDALVCCHHGARYRPESGECFAGPCVGGRLTPLAVEERDGALWCTGPRD